MEMLDIFNNSQLYSFSQKHIAIEHGGKTYKCTQCDYVAYVSGAMKQHQRSHKPIGDYYCALCDKYFKYKQIFKSHEMKHQGDLPFR